MLADEYIVMSRGHHDIHDFMKAVRADGYEYPLECLSIVGPRLSPIRLVSTATSFVFVEEGTRGAIPVTYAWETYGKEVYEEVFATPARPWAPPAEAALTAGR